MSEVSLREWNEYIKLHPGAHLLQTAQWGELKAAFGWDAVRVVCEDLGAQILFRRLPLGLSIAYLPKPVFDPIASTSVRFWGEVASVCRRKRAIFLKVEPDGWGSVETAGAQAAMPQVRAPLAFRRSAFNIQPPRTLVVDLRGTEEDILARMKQKCRYNIRLAEKKGVSVRPWDDLERFYALMQATGERDAFGVHSLDYYRRAYDLFHSLGNCELLLAEHENKPLAALMVFKHGLRSWYLYGASNEVERNRMPAYLLQWEAMRWAKARGCQAYDLWGVPDADEAFLESNFESRQDGLWGVYRFKRGFGGELRRAPQSSDAIFDPVLYRLYLWRMAGRETG